MMAFIIANLATIIITIILIVIVALIISRVVRNHKQGNACSYGCKHCPGSSTCHGQDNQNKQ